MTNLTPQTEQSSEPIAVITVRLPASLHARAKREALACDLSLNMFCVNAIEDDVERMEALREDAA